jgi:hypothetical protein
MAIRSSYSYTTSRYGLPVWGDGDQSSGFDNKRAGDIIDSQLEAVKGLVSFSTTYPGAVISEGVFSATFATGNSELSVASLKAIVNGVFIETTSAKTKNGFANNGTYYVYATLVETDPVSATSKAKRHWDISYGTNGITPADSLLIGKFVTTGAAATIWYTEAQLPSINAGSDTEKYYYKSMQDHRGASQMDHPSGSVRYWHLGANSSIQLTQIRPYGPSLADYQATMPPYSDSVGASFALPSTLQGEILRIRHQLGKMIGGSVWYQAPSINLAMVASSFASQAIAGPGPTSGLISPIGASVYSGGISLAARVDHWHPVPGATIVSANGALGYGAEKILCSAAGVMSLGLPTANPLLHGLVVKNLVGQTVVLFGQGSNTIEGNNTLTLNSGSVNLAYRLFSGPSHWHIGGRY